jgi:hypothetical protein
MAKLIILSFVFMFIFSGKCSDKSDIHSQKDDSTGQRVSSDNIRNDLFGIEEPEAGFDYSELISTYSGLHSDNFSVTRFRNFVIFSDLDEPTTFSIIDKDIRYTIDAMKRNYMRKSPQTVTPIIIFKDYEEYKNFAVGEFGIDPTDLSPYGFYKVSKNIIAIKYVTWKGSPSHEVTHAMIQADFPEIPSWFNEGMAALNEKSTYKDGDLIGDFSWRILSVKRAFNEDTYTGLEDLMSTNDDELYSKKASFYYAQSRYLLMYLQQQGLLKEYYKTFRDTFSEDKTGMLQLMRVSGKSIETLDAELETYLKSFN